MYRITLTTIKGLLALLTGLNFSLANNSKDKLPPVSALLESLSKQRQNLSEQKATTSQAEKAFQKAFAEVTALREKYLLIYKEKAHSEERALHRLYYLLQYHENALKNKNKDQGCSRLSFELERDKTSTREFKEALAWAELLCPKLKN